MKLFRLLFLSLLLAAFACAQGGSLSTVIEPAMKAPAQFGIAFSGAINVDRDTSVTALYGFSDSVAPTRTVLVGVGRDLVEFLPGVTLVSDFRAGWVYSRHAGQPACVYGVGVATDVGGGFTVTYGAHVNKIRDTKLYPSLYVSVAKTF